ncbi:MAG: DNA/RNA non-specific endonuclease [Candidatus Dadabacteria bacterium]|nr:DNA/RNA non-specific endonuclease [Candidatus Dadabacteria bacterium]
MLAFLIIQASAQENHSDLCMHGCPSGSPATNDIIIRDIYILSSNDSTKFADWVAYRVTKDTIGQTQKRTWRADSRLADDETLEPKDYDGAFAALKTDRGHQAPLASFTATPSWKATNYLSNITPQKSELNQGPWKRLEDEVRTLAKKPDTNAVYVITGPLYEREMPVLPKADESHKVPSGYWKIISTEKNDIIKVAAFLFDQETERSAKFCEKRFITSVRTIESKTGLNFFHALPEKEQEELETGPPSLLADLRCTQ